MRYTNLHLHTFPTFLPRVLRVGEFEYSLPNLRTSSLHPKLCWIWQQHMDFTEFFTDVRSGKTMIERHVFNDKTP